MRRECRERFPRSRLQRKPLASDPCMHHGTCVTHVLWCMPGSLTRGGGENVLGIPGACANPNFTYLIRGPSQQKAQPNRGHISGTYFTKRFSRSVYAVMENGGDENYIVITYIFQSVIQNNCTMSFSYDDTKQYFVSAKDTGIEKHQSILINNCSFCDIISSLAGSYVWIKIDINMFGQLQMLNEGITAAFHHKDMIYCRYSDFCGLQGSK